MVDVVSVISEDFSDLIGFAYELRKVDKDDQYSYMLVNGLLKIDLLEKMVLSNKWDDNKKTMVPTEHNKFKLYVGQDSYLLSTSATKQNRTEAIVCPQSEI